MSTFGDELVGVGMNCTLGDCAGEDCIGIVGFVIVLLTNFILGFVCDFPVSSLGSSMEALLCRGYVRTFLVQCPKILWKALIAKSFLSHI